MATIRSGPATEPTALTVAWVAFSIWVSQPWRDDLEQAIGPVMAWVIPLFLAYIPGLVIGFMIFTLLITRYRELALEPPDAIAKRVVGRSPRAGARRFVRPPVTWRTTGVPVSA